MQASFDDGATWHRAPVDSGADGTFTAAVPEASGSGRTGYVSLRMTAHDGAGNGVTQEVTRAYSLTD